MRIIRNINTLQQSSRGCVLTIGNFDGFHRGHQALIAKLQNEGRIRGLPVMVIIFEPQPQEHFAGKEAPARLTQLRDKVKYLAAAGVDTILCINFNHRFATLGARSFVTNFLVQKLGVRFIGIGDDFRFGAKREGDFSFLKQVGKENGFEVMRNVTYTEDGKRVSSTAVREALAQDRIAEAEMLLGHSYHLSGRVIYGDALGRTIGFPTANISFKKGLRVPIHGVYVVEVYGIADIAIPGVANIGIRPTVTGNHQRLEVHLLNINQNLYGRHIKVVIRAKLRNEQRFNSINELKRQISNDVVIARNYFESLKNRKY